MNWDRIEGNWKEFKGNAQRSGASSRTTTSQSWKASAPSFPGGCSNVTAARDQAERGDRHLVEVGPN